MSRRLALAVAASCLLTILAPCVWGSEAEEKAQKAFDALYGADVKRVMASRDTTQAVALAARLLDSAKAAEDQPELMALLCTKACELGAMDPKGHETAQAAADLVVSKAPEAAGPCQEVLATLRLREYDTSRGGAKAEAGEALIDALLALAATHTQAGRIEEAGKPLYKASGVAKAIKSSKIETIDAQIKAHADRQKSAAELARLKRQVEADPANAKARDPLVLLLVVGFDNPAEAAKYLTDASDATLKKFVPAAAKPVADVPEMACLELMDWYVTLAATAGPAGKAAMYARAVGYGERFLELHEAKDLDRTRVELAVKKAQDETARLGGDPLARGRWVDLLKLVDLQKDVLAGEWRRDGRALVVTRADPTPPNPNCRLMIPLAPEGNYEMEVRFVYVGTTTVGIGLPVGTRKVNLFLAAMYGQAGGLHMISGRGFMSNETTVKPNKLVSGREYLLQVKVTSDRDQAQVAAILDGNPFISWKGPVAALSPGGWGWDWPDPKRLGIGGASTLLSARLRMLSGKAEPTRPIGAAKSDTKPAEKQPKG